MITLTDALWPCVHSMASSDVEVWKYCSHKLVCSVSCPVLWPQHTDGLWFWWQWSSCDNKSGGWRKIIHVQCALAFGQVLLESMHDSTNHSAYFFNAAAKALIRLPLPLVNCMHFSWPFLCCVRTRFKLTSMYPYPWCSDPSTCHDIYHMYLYVYIIYVYMYDKCININTYMWYVYFCTRSSLASGSWWHARMCTGKSSSSTRQAANYTDMCCSPETKMLISKLNYTKTIYLPKSSYICMVCLPWEGTSTIN